MRSALAHAAQRRAERKQTRNRSNSLNTVPPSESSDDYLPELAAIAASILYRSPLPSKDGRPVYILNAAAFPDAFEVDYDTLLSYVLARLPGEDELLSGTEYEVIFFAGGQTESATSEKKQGPGMGWYLQAYHVLSRALRKKLQRLYIVHPRTWVRVLVGVFGTVVSPKFRRKIIHINTLSALALNIPLETLLIPPSVYLHDRKLSPDIYAPFATGRRAFGVRHPLPKNINTGEERLPRVLRETTSFVVAPSNVKMEGLFRIPPHSTLAGVLKEAYDRGQQFVVWKERTATVVQPGIDQPLVDEIRLEDAYGVHQAASLIKQWYRDLREPIFPESSYEALTVRYGDAEAEINAEDLVGLIVPQGDSSPLTLTSRRILTRHLLPLLSEVAAQEADNKMSSENLAICFSMCLLCGSNQMEDAKMSAIIKRILKAAIEEWLLLREGMSLSRESFFGDLQPPADLYDYEDPLEEQRPPPTQRAAKIVEDGAMDDEEGHRIILEDSDDRLLPEKTPTLPPRPEMAGLSLRAPTLPARKSSPPSASSISPASSEPSSAIPKRKPAPPIIEPPRYSTVFDADGNSIHVADSPASYVPVDGFGPPKRSNWSIDESEKKGFPPLGFPEPADPHPALNMPKRKALSSEARSSDPAEATDNARSASDGALLAKMAAKKAASNLAQQAAAAFATRPADARALDLSSEISDTSSSTTAPTSIQSDDAFRKPSWPASARPTTLAKPIQPVRHTQTFPAANGGSHDHLSAPTVPKPRALSPGLMKRVSSYETASSQAGPEPRRLDLKKPSVEDLRRLYEERASTAQSLARAGSARSASASN